MFTTLSTPHSVSPSSYRLFIDSSLDLLLKFISFDIGSPSSNDDTLTAILIEPNQPVDPPYIPQEVSSPDPCMPQVVSSLDLPSLHHSTQVCEPPIHLHKFYYYFAILTLHQYTTYRKPRSNLYW